MSAKIGMPGHLYLEQFGAVCVDAFGLCVYHVGSSMEANGKDLFRDVDVRVILDDAEYEAMGLGDPAHPQMNAKWVALTLAFAALGKSMTGLPIDFQIQQQGYANDKFPNGRSALGIRTRLRHTQGSPV